MLVPTPCCPPCNPPHLKCFSVLPSHILSARKHTHGIVCKFEVGSKGVGRKDLNLFVEPALVVIARSMYTCVIPSSASPKVTCLFSAITGDGKRTYVVKTRGPLDGRFTFTHKAGDHSICLSTNYTTWWSTMHVKLYLNVSDVKPNIERDRSHIPELASKVSEREAGGCSTNVSGRGFEIPLCVFPFLVIAMCPCPISSTWCSRTGLSRGPVRS